MRNGVDLNNACNAQSYSGGDFTAPLLIYTREHIQKLGYSGLITPTHQKQTNLKC